MTNQEIQNLLKSQLTLAGSKLAADSMLNLITPLGLSILSILWTLGRTKKTNIFQLVARDWTTVSHTITGLVQRKLILEEVKSHKEKYLCLSTEGYEIYTAYIREAARKSEELKELMPKPHIANRRMGSL